MPLRAMKSEDWPATCGWLTSDNSSALGRAIVLRAMCDVGILEVPLASNRGVRIDRYAKRGGSPLGSWWCALFVGAVFADCGALVPSEYGATRNWLPYVQSDPVIGAAILYGVHNVPHHIGIVARLDPMPLSIEGNRAFAGSSNNGVAVDLGPILRRDILGYIHPRAA